MKEHERSCSSNSCCRVESIVGVDERGQMILPKEIRERMEIGAGDKLVLVGWEKEGRICCLSLIKADQFEDMVKGLLGPMIKEISGSAAADIS